MYLAAKRILVVDSNAARREQTLCTLAAEGFAVTGSAEGLAAIRAAGQHRFALAVIAAELPGTLDGRTTLRHLRARQPGLRALFTGDPAHWPAGSARGRDDFLPVPLTRRHLVGCVLELLERDARRQRAAGAAIGRAG